MKKKRRTKNRERKKKGVESEELQEGTYITKDQCRNKKDKKKKKKKQTTLRGKGSNRLV